MLFVPLRHIIAPKLSPGNIIVATSLHFVGMKLKTIQNLQTLSCTVLNMSMNIYSPDPFNMCIHPYVTLFVVIY